MTLAVLTAGSCGTLHAVENPRSGDVRVSGKQSAAEIEDLGDIEKAAADESLKFRANASVHADYTSNALLTGNHTSSDLLFFPTLEAGLHQQLGKKFSFDLATKLESVFYTKYDEHGFAGYSATATLDYRPKPTLPRLFIGAEPYRFDSYDTGNLISQAIGVSAGTDWGFAFNKGNSLAFMGYTLVHYFADPTVESRTANKAVLGVTHRLKDQLYGQLVYSYQFTDYENIAREDSRHAVVLSFIYQINRHLFSNVSGSWVDNDSTQTGGSYQSAGASVGLNWQF